MDLFEYQGKELYKKYDIATPNSMVVDLVEKIDTTSLQYPLVVKAQVQVGGRGKAGGIKLVSNEEELLAAANEIMGMDIKNHVVKKLLIEEASDVQEEYYISFTLDRSKKQYLMLLSSKGGMDIEKVAEENPDDVIKVYIAPSIGIENSIVNEALLEAGIPKEYHDDLEKMISSLFNLFVDGDCDLVEVNPLAIVNEGKVLALDSKISLDMNAVFRHEEYKKFEEDIPIPDTEKVAKEKGLNFIKLEGDVGIIGNGAGLVMSTLDVVSSEGGSAANFLDIGGGAKSKNVSDALEILQDDKSVKSVLINIFGGITRCDLVAEGIVDATREKSLPWKIVVRLDGTNAQEGREILKANPHENIVVVENMKEAARLAVSI
ncbi:MAG: ADP-forming succinate--CoA ligase subunit beta [Actinobacteria bacterium]|nr:ADP-forming succinate--CoA ligase subunit beta [Actinomycetota bacterium]|tara:strand:- start:3801 stop:4928 length:1128 start_codon:yes stop_codon:yes gene_type:complete